MVCRDCISGVPPLALPKIRSSVGRSASAHLVGALGVIDAREHLQALRGHVGRQPVDGVLDAVCAFDRHHTIVSHRSRSILPS